MYNEHAQWKLLFNTFSQGFYQMQCNYLYKDHWKPFSIAALIFGDSLLKTQGRQC